MKMPTKPMRAPTEVLVTPVDAPSPPGSPVPAVIEEIDTDAKSDASGPKSTKTTKKSGITIGKGALECYANKHGFTYEQLFADLEDARVEAKRKREIQNLSEDDLPTTHLFPNEEVLAEIKRREEKSIADKKKAADQRAAKKQRTAAKDERLAYLEARYAADTAAAQ